ncbi:MAG: hypothetical protein JJV97_00905 [SAR324 cluster bacterium]|nr:hypothetical protein [SAR324 cluster bacterium]
MKKVDWRRLVQRLLLKFSAATLVAFSFFRLAGFAVPAKILNVEPIFDDSSTKISLTLDRNYGYLPRIEPNQGILRLGMHNLIITHPTNIKGQGDVISNISLRQNGSESILEISLHNLLQSTTNMADYEIGDKSILFTITHHPEILPSTLGIPEAKKIATPALSADNYSITSASSLKFIFYLVAALALAFIGIKGYQHLLVRRKNLAGFGDNVKLLNIYHLSSKQKIWIIKIAEIKYALGITPSAMSLICEINNEYDALIANIVNRDDVSLAKIRVAIDEMEIAQKKNGKSATSLGGIKNLTKFKQELKLRLKKLTPVK